MILATTKILSLIFITFLLSISTSFAQKGGDDASFKVFLTESIQKLKKSPAQFEAECILYPLAVGTGSRTNYTYEKLETLSKDDLKRYFTNHIKVLTSKKGYIASSLNATEDNLFAFRSAYEFTPAAIENGDVSVAPDPVYKGIINENDVMYVMSCSLPDGTFLSWYCIYLDDTQEYKIWGAIYGE